MKTLLSILFAAFPLNSFAQWEKQIGINLAPLVGKTVEVNAEFARHKGYAFTLSAGHTFGTGHQGWLDYKVYDFIHDRKTSGTFGKAGMKLYPFGWDHKPHQNNFYIDGAVVISQYDQTALRRLEDGDGILSDNYIPVSANGVLVFPAASLGFVNRLGKKLLLDWGIQKSFVTREGDYLGTRRRNYQPGAGTPQSDPFIGYLQGIVSLKYRF